VSDPFSFFLSWTPILSIAFLAVGLKRQALELAVWGALYTTCLTLFPFRTPAPVVLLAAADGVVTNLPLLLVIYFGMLLCGLLLDSGSLVRVVGWFSSLSRDRWHNIVLIAVGSGNFMEGSGIVAEPIIAPMLRAAGLPATGSASLSIAGYSGLMILELGGAILAVLILVTGLDGGKLGHDVALLSLPATMIMTLAIPWLLGETVQIKTRFFLLSGAGLLAGGGGLFAVDFVGAPVAGLFGGLVVLLWLCLAGTRRWTFSARLLKDMAPLLFLVICLFSVNLIGPLKRVAIEAWPANVTIVPGHDIRFQPFFSAYTYILLAYLLAVALIRDRGAAWQNFLGTNRRAWRPILAMALFGAAGQIIAYSGYAPGFSTMDPSRNIGLTLANGMVNLSGRFYPFFAPLIGWVGTFLTGYGTASIVLFGKLHVTTAELLGVSPSLLAGGMAVGSAVGSVSSPLKVALAASMCEATGREGEILRRTIPLGIGASLVLGAILMIMLF
jgi:lactate permease